MTRQELDEHVRSLKSVGGVYDYVASAVEHLSAPHLERETA